MNLDRVKKIEVMSATLKYLIFGIVAIICAIALEVSGIYNIVISAHTPDLSSSIVIIFILQIPVLLCLMFTILIKCYKNKTKFELFLCDLEDVHDFEFLKQNYYLVNINERQVLFCRQAFSDCAEDWKVLQLDPDKLDTLFENSKNICDYSKDGELNE